MPESCPVKLEPNEDRGWLDREPTIDEQEVVAWLERHDRPQALLHVGIGNALLFSEFGRSTVQGLSRDGAEVAHATQLGLDAILCNKYDVGSYASRLRGPFDWIVDVNIRSYACCDRHFSDYMSTMLDSLSADGKLLTSTRGLGYLVPTSLDELRRICPDWRVRKDGNVVIMRPRPAIRIRKTLAKRGRR